jgi:hypothetical protein
MTQRGERLGLAFEALLEVRVGGDVFGEDFDSDGAIQAGVASFVNFAHPTRTDGGLDFVRPETSAGTESHLTGVACGL